jgi:hypothetical protein
LQKLASYCSENDTTKIRFNELRDLCDEYLYSYSGGFQTHMGGNFDKLVIELQSEGFLERKKISPRRTFLVPNITKIEGHFHKNKLKKSLDNMNSVVELSLMGSPKERYSSDMHQRSFFEHVQISEKLGVKSIRAKSKDFLKKDAGPGLSATLESDLVKISAASTNGTEVVTIDKYTTLQLLDSVQQIVRQNKAYQPFMVILRYNGIPQSLDELIKSERFFDFYQGLSTYFIEWAEHFERYKISQQEKSSLLQSKIEDLSEDGKERLRIFLKDLIDNIAKDHVSIPIVSEIYQKLSNKDED